MKRLTTLLFADKQLLTFPNPQKRLGEKSRDLRSSRRNREGLVWGDRPYICGPLGFTSVITCGLYTVSWQFDPCCQYQVETDTSKLPHVELLAVLGPSSPTFLVRKDDKRRRILHTTVALAAFGITAWRVYQAFK
ncbi:TMM11 protein, partial [Acromyrmex heyeri]